MAGSTVVIKFKYEDVLRRCKFFLIENFHDVNLKRLKQKALSLFGLARETELLLTYDDEDGDTIPLANANDFLDVVEQELDPVRITVKVISQNNAGRLNQSNFRSAQNLGSKNVENLIKLHESLTTDKLSASSGKSRAQTITKETCISKSNDDIPKVQETDIDGGSVQASSSETHGLEGENLGDSSYDGPETEISIASDPKDCLDGVVVPRKHRSNLDRVDRVVVPRKHKPYKIKAYWDRYEANMVLVDTMVHKISVSKLDSFLIEHVTFKDDTIMRPLTQFTKIWRMMNGGMTAWPQETRLICSSIGGFNRYSVELEIPEGGVPVGGVLDIAVDLVAPAVPGRYVSFWRMASSGVLLGPRLFVLIQVDASAETRTITANVEPELEPEPYIPSEVVHAPIPTPTPLLDHEKLKVTQMLERWEELLRRSSAKTRGYAHFGQNKMAQAPAPTPSLNSQSYEEQLKLTQKQIQRQLQRLEDLQQLQQRHRDIKTREQSNMRVWASHATPVIGPNSLTILTSLTSQRHLEVIERHKHMQKQMEEMQLKLLEEQLQEQRELSERAGGPTRSTGERS